MKDINIYLEFPPVGAQLIALCFADDHGGRNQLRPYGESFPDYFSKVYHRPRGAQSIAPLQGIISGLF